MTPEQRALILKLADEYGKSLARSDDEKSHQKAIAARAQREGAVKSAWFVRLATAVHKQNVTLERTELSSLNDLFALVFGEEVP